MNFFQSPLASIVGDSRLTMCTAVVNDYTDQRLDTSSTPLTFRTDPRVAGNLTTIHEFVDFTKTVGRYGKYVMLPFFGTFGFMTLSTSLLLVFVWWANAFATAFFGSCFLYFVYLEEGAYQIDRCVQLAIQPEATHLNEEGQLATKLKEVRAAIAQIDRMNENVKFLQYVSWPLNQAFVNIKGNLEAIETHITQQLTPK